MQATCWGEIFAILISDKRLISDFIFKTHLQINKKTNNPILGWAIDLNKSFTKDRSNCPTHTKRYTDMMATSVPSSDSCAFHFL